MLFERRATQGHVDRVLAFTAEFIALNVDVIAVVTTGASLAAKSATSKIPLVMLTVSDPVDNGLVNSLARPGGNITGIADLVVRFGSSHTYFLAANFRCWVSA